MTGLETIAQQHLVLFFHSLFNQWYISLIEQTGSNDCLPKTLRQKKKKNHHSGLDLSHFLQNDYFFAKWLFFVTIY